jgi:molybdopterin molybdotransferase
MQDQQLTYQPGCEDELNTGLLSVAQARARILAAVEPVRTAETLPLREALGRVLAGAIVAPLDVPSHTNSAMDGYAVRATDLPKEGVCEFRVPGTSWAGRPWLYPIEPGQAVQIMTGAMMPEGADTVVMQEQVERDGDRVRIGTGHHRGQNVRAAGEDVAAGQPVFAAGKRLSAADIGVLASLGLAEVAVFGKLKVAFFSSGDELRSVGEVLGPGEIYDSNRYTLYGLLRKLDADIIDLGVVRDRRELIEQAISTAAATADVIITSGGVSVGEADFVKETLEKLGSLSFWKIAMKPGRPVAFGHFGEVVFFGLPGNPVSVMVTWFQFVRPALLKMSGETAPPAAFTVRARVASPLRKSPGRFEFQRGIFEQSAPGEFVVRSAGAQGSGILRSMSEANCFILLDPDRTSVEPGEEVEVQPFQNLI